MIDQRQAWLAWRREGIGSSDAAAIAGLDPWRGAMRVYLDKIGELSDEGEEFEYQRWGNLLQPAMVEEFQRRTDLWVVAQQASLTHEKYDWMRATVDGIVSESPDGAGTPLGVYEAKTSAGFKDAQWAEGVPEHYRVQVQHQLAVTGLARAWVAVLHGGNRFVVYDVDRDEKVIALLLRIERVFWEQNVLLRRPPDADGMESSTDALREAFRHAEAGHLVDLGEQGATLIDNLRYARDVRAAAEKQEERAKQALMARLGSAEGGLVDGRVVVTWKAEKRTTIDLESFRNQEPLMARRFEVTKEHRGALRLKGDK